MWFRYSLDILLPFTGNFVAIVSVNTMCAGDHIPWHNPLDGSESRIQHMILSEDPQLKSITTSLGAVSFIQVRFQILFLPEEEPMGVIK